MEIGQSFVIGLTLYTLIFQKKSCLVVVLNTEKSVYLEMYFTKLDVREQGVFCIGRCKHANFLLKFKQLERKRNLISRFSHSQHDIIVTIHLLYNREKYSFNNVQ